MCVCVLASLLKTVHSYDTSRVASGVPKSINKFLVMDGPDGSVLSRDMKLKRIATKVFSSTGECHVHLWLKKPSTRKLKKPSTRKP